jgi:hypothetical protein
MRTASISPGTSTAVRNTIKLSGRFGRLGQSTVMVHGIELAPTEEYLYDNRDFILLPLKTMAPGTEYTVADNSGGQP